MTRPGDVWVNLQNQAVEFDDGARVRDLMPQSVFIDAATSRWRLRPGTGVNVGTQLQDMLNEAPLGSTIVFENGEYILNDAISMTRQLILRFAGHWITQNAITISANNSEIQLAAGCYIEKDPNGTAIEPFLFAGTTPTAWDDITVDAAAGEVTITVTTPANFAAGDWIKIKDNQTAWTGTSGTHWETNQVRSKAGSVLTLEFPLSDSYVTISTVKPSVSLFTPVVSSGIIGPGKISNGSASDASIGNAGVRFSHAVDGYCRFIEAFQCQQEGIRYFDSFAGDISNNYCRQMSNFQIGGVGSGRGITVSRSTHTTIANNRIFRTRHAVDISNFCRHVLVTGNIIRGSGLTALQTHPDVKWATFSNNLVDGAYGYVTNGGAEWGTVRAPGFSIRENNQFIYCDDNQFENCYEGAIALQTVDSCSDIYIRRNKIDRCNLGLSTTVVAGIDAWAGTLSTGDNWVIEDNVVSNCPGRGIMWGISHARIRRNTIRDITSSGDTAGILIRPYISAGTPDAINDIEVSDNDIEASAGYGIEIGNAAALTTNVNVKKNKVKDTVLSGIFAAPANVDDLTIAGNDVDDPNTGVSSAHGAIVVGAQASTDNNSTNLVISKNRVNGGTSSRGIVTCVNDARIIANEVYCPATNAQGIYIPSPNTTMTTTGIIVAKNVVWGTPNAIYVGDSTTYGNVQGAIIDGNVCVGNTNGIRIRALAVDTILVGNITEANTTDINDTGTTTRIITHYDTSNYRLGVGTGAPDSVAHIVGKIHGSDELELDGALNHDGTTAGFYGATPASQSTGWSVTNETTDKSFDADATTIDELADVLGTLIEYLKTIGILGA